MVVFNQRQEISGRDSGQVRRGIAEIGGTFLFAAKGGLWRLRQKQLIFIFLKESFEFRRGQVVY